MTYQQGDIIFRKVNSIPRGAKRIKDFPIIVAQGETTGHAHKVLEEVKAFLDERENTRDEDGRKVMYLEGPATVVHEEHGTVNLPEGIYMVDHVKEYDHFLEESRQLRD